MLRLNTRATFATLLDALSLQPGTEPALTFVATDATPQTWTRTDFVRQVTQSAGALQAQGVQPRDVIGIARGQSLQGMALFWGALLMGAVPSMLPPLTEKLDPDVYMQQMSQLVDHAQPGALFTTDTLAPALQEIVACPVYGSHDLNLTSGTAQPVHHPPQPQQIAFLQHSSGTTGLQKGVALSHEAVLNQIASYSDALNVQADDVIVSWLPLYHDMGLIAGFLLPLLQGIPLVIMSPFDWVRHPALLLRTISEYEGTLCWLPNFAYQHCARRIRLRDIDGVSLHSMRAFINCSEPVSASSHRRFYERFQEYGIRQNQFAVSYAMAENTFAVTQTLPGQPPVHDWVDENALIRENHVRPADPQADNALELVSCGLPVAHVSVRVVSDNGDVLPERRVGEIQIQSNCMLTEYYRRPDLNDDLLTDGWYRTGDTGYLADNQLYVIGRKKDLIINAGKNIYPRDIEAIVNTVEGVRPGRVVVFGVPDEREGTELIAIIAEPEPDITTPQAEATIKKRIRQAVARESTVTASYVSLVKSGWLLKTSSGKIARAANRQKWLQDKL